jgi:Cys-Gly metallodipeptidase DUG1
VPNQNVKTVTSLIIKYLDEEFKKLDTKTKMILEVVGGGEPWVVSTDSRNYVAGKKATMVCFDLSWPP